MIQLRYRESLLNPCCDISTFPLSAEFSEQMQTHDNEEEDTSMIRHCWYIAKRGSFTSSTICSYDADVFILLLHFYLSLAQSLAFRTGKGTDLRKTDIASCYEAIGSSRADVFVGFHTFTGCDQTGRFSVKSKLFWWREF